VRARLESIGFYCKWGGGSPSSDREYVVNGKQLGGNRAVLPTTDAADEEEEWGGERGRDERSGQG
jgi:hypothetical protein